MIFFSYGWINFWIFFRLISGKFNFFIWVQVKDASFVVKSSKWAAWGSSWYSSPLNILSQASYINFFVVQVYPINLNIYDQVLYWFVVVTYRTPLVPTFVDWCEIFFVSYNISSPWVFKARHFYFSVTKLTVKVGLFIDCVL